MWQEIKSTFHILIIFQCLIFVLYLISHKETKKSSKLIFISLLVVKIMIESGGIFCHYSGLKEIAIREAPLLLYAYVPFKFVYIPILYFYIISLTKKNFKVKVIHSLHLIPFVIALGNIILKFYSIDIDVVRELINKGEFLSGFYSKVLIFFEYLQFFCYATLSLAVIRKYRKNIKAAFSSIEKINLSWLNLVLWGLISWNFIRFLEYFLWLTVEGIQTQTLYIMYTLAEITFLTFITLLFLKGIKQPLMFFSILEEVVKEKYEKTGLPDIQKEVLEEKIKQFMADKKPYLNPSLNIKELASNLSIPAHHLSQVINSKFNQNFFDFINSYRIEESKRLLKEYSPHEKTVLEILYEVGFNSKSVFNTAFKKSTGTTPTQYRKNQTLKVA